MFRLNHPADDWARSGPAVANCRLLSPERKMLRRATRWQQLAPIDTPRKDVTGGGMMFLTPIAPAVRRVAHARLFRHPAGEVARLQARGPNLPRRRTG